MSLSAITQTLADVLKNPSVLVHAFLRFSPAVFKFVAALLLLVNIRSWPLVWHFNVLILPIYEIRVRYWAVVLRNLFASKKQKLQAKEDFLNSLCPVGKDPIRFTVAVKNWAGPDDCDFNWHLSNSSYPKQLDSARFRAGLEVCPTFYRAGGWTPLGATHFKFIREIPIFATYEMRIGMVAWDNKWGYIVVRYVTKAKKSKKDVKPKADTPPPSGDSAPFPAMHTPVAPSGTSTPALSGSGSSTPPPPFSSNPAERIAQMLPEEEDGATLHCISVCELCFKVGRITVPPAIVLALEGFSNPPPSSSSSDPLKEHPSTYSLSNPPPNFIETQKLLAPDAPYGHTKTLQNFLRGGWRDVPAGERWWEDALGGDIEVRRARNLELVKGVTLGLQGALQTYSD